MAFASSTVSSEWEQTLLSDDQLHGEPMCIQYMSDLHFESYPKIKDDPIQWFENNIPINPNADVCVLAGDINNPTDLVYAQFLGWLEDQHFEVVIVICGNHEYYNSGTSRGMSKEQIEAHIQSVCDELDHVHFLNCGSFDYKGYRFLGCTLWSHQTFDGYVLTDCSRTTDGEFKPGRLIDHSVWAANDLHSRHMLWLDGALQQCKDDNVTPIVVTHHVPSFELLNQEYIQSSELATRRYNQGFACEAKCFFNKHIVAWFFGHSHKALQRQYMGVQFCCNPIGNPDEKTGGEFGRVVYIS